jgi:Domain of unknown function (DUF4838)
MNILFKAFFIFNIFLCTCVNGEELIRNGDFTKELSLSGTVLGWRINKGIENVSKCPEGLCMRKKFRVLQRLDVSHEISTKFSLTVRLKVKSGKLYVFAQAFLPGVIKRESYYTLASKSYSPDANWQEVKLTLQLPPEKIVDQIQIAFSSSSMDTLAYVSNVSIVPVLPTSKKTNKIFLLSDQKKTLCKGIFVSLHGGYFEKIAAKILQKYIYKITGYVLPVKFFDKNKIADLTGVILLGKGTKSAGSGGFLIENKNATLSIIGKDDSGLIAGVYAFLKTLGVNFLSSSEVKYPHMNTLKIKPMNICRTPAFPFRRRSSIFNPEFLLKSFVAAPRRLGGANNAIHTNSFLVNFDKYHKKHPEYFALQKNGKRLSNKPQGCHSYVHLCLSNPEVQKIASENLLEWIKLDPNAKYFFISQGDVQRFRCKCKKCKAMDYEKGNYTDRVLTFVNKVTAKAAHKYPDKVFFMLLYEGADKMPIKTKPASRVSLVYCPFSPKWWCHSHAFCEHNKDGINDIKKWFKKYPGKLYIFDYPAGAKESLSIFGSFYAMVDKIRFYHTNGVKGVTLCGSPKQFNALFINIISKLLWNPKMDVEAAIDSFMKEYYGKAAPYMRQYFNLIYKEIKTRPIHQHCELFNSGFVTKPFRLKAYKCFYKAENVVRTQPEFLKRVKNEKLFLLYNDLNKYNPYSGLLDKKLNIFAKKLAEFARIAKRLGLFYIDRRHNVKKWFWEVAGLKLKGTWYRDPQIAKLIEAPLKTLKNRKYILQIPQKNGFEIPLSAFKGGEPARNGKYIVLRRPALLKPIISANFYLKKQASKDMELILTGQEEHDCRIEIFVNGKRILLKKAKEMFYIYPRRYDWKIFGKKHVVIPGGILRKGENTIQIKNSTPESFIPGNKKATSSCGYQPNQFWGWLIVKKVEIKSNKKN